MTGLCSVRREDARGWRSKRISALMMMMRTGGYVVVRGSARKVVRFQAYPSFIDVDSDSPVATSENAGLGQLCLPLCLCLCRCLLLVGLPQPGSRGVVAPGLGVRGGGGACAQVVSRVVFYRRAAFCCYPRRNTPCAYWTLHVHHRQANSAPAATPLPPNRRAHTEYSSLIPGARAVSRPGVGITCRETRLACCLQRGRA